MSKMLKTGRELENCRSRGVKKRWTDARDGEDLESSVFSSRYTAPYWLHRGEHGTAGVDGGKMIFKIFLFFLQNI